MTRLPADRCAICDRPLSETGGVRIIAHQNVGVILADATRTLDELILPCHVRKVNGSFVVTWGGCWTDDAIRRVEIAVAAESRPWLCQPCAGLRTRAGADWLRGDGQIVHAPAGVEPS